jgi:hypothetical protein
MITDKEFKKMRLTTEERIKLLPELDNDALIKLTLSLKENRWPPRYNPKIPTSYEEEIIYFCVPELIKRLETVK